ncbi:MAG: SAM-dependent chlorinase/fluorinase [Anaerolineae bacterium]
METDQPPIIALLTDFGMADGYVAAMKGVILGIAPAARIVDITHAIDAQDVRQAAYVLLTTYAYFPARTVFVAVVDPGVGTARRALAIETAHGRFVCPDNGLCSYVLDRQPPVAQVEVAEPAYLLAARSHTFHGRDVFAPAAAHLARGVPTAALGPAVDAIGALPPPRLEVTGSGVAGEVIHVDRFGNVVTSVGSLFWEDAQTLLLEPRFGAASPSVRIPAASAVSVGGATVQGIRHSYGHVAAGAALALVNSAGQLEVAINGGHAARALGVAVGDPVAVRFG